jgi:signal transduction histidine kinase
VEAMVDKLAHSSSIAFRCTCERIDTILPKGSEIHLYRIIQESLSNLVKHSGATSAHVEIFKKADSVEVTVSDDGQGFDATEFGPTASARNGPADVARGFGITSMAERARIIGAKFKIESMQQRGTVIIVSIPIRERE